MNKKKILLITIPLIILAAIVVVAFSVNKKNNENGVFNLLYGNHKNKEIFEEIQRMVQPRFAHNTRNLRFLYIRFVR